MLCTGVELKSVSGSDNPLHFLGGHKHKRSRSSRRMLVLSRAVTSDGGGGRTGAHRALKLLHAFSWHERLDKGSADGCRSVSQGPFDEPHRGGSASGGFSNSPERSMSQTFSHSSKNSKRESYKAQKKTYRSQKKEAAKELLSTITDPSVVLLGDWLKVRGTLKSWTKLWCVLKPGVLILYKSDKQKRSQWVGTILLNTCQLLERPSKKDGFCFKLFHPLDQSIWATKGPKGETIGAFVQPLPYSYCIFRASSEAAGKCWMDALELALKCTNLLKRSMTRLDTSLFETHDIDTENIRKQGELLDGKSSGVGANGHDDLDGDQSGPNFSPMRLQENHMNESDLERHFANQGIPVKPTSFTQRKTAAMQVGEASVMKNQSSNKQRYLHQPATESLYRVVGPPREPTVQMHQHRGSWHMSEASPIVTPDSSQMMKPNNNNPVYNEMRLEGEGSDPANSESRRYHQQDPHQSAKKPSIWEAISDALRGRKESEPYFQKPTADELYYALLTLKIKNVRTETLKFELEIERLQNEISRQDSWDDSTHVVYNYKEADA